jgi:hypothetical protein
VTKSCTVENGRANEGSRIQKVLSVDYTSSVLYSMYSMRQNSFMKEHYEYGNSNIPWKVIIDLSIFLIHGKKHLFMLLFRIPPL